MKKQLTVFSLSCILLSGCAATPSPTHQLVSDSQPVESTEEGRDIENENPVSTNTAPAKVIPVGYSDATGSLDSSAEAEETTASGDVLVGQDLGTITPFVIETNAIEIDVAPQSVVNLTTYTLSDLEGLAIANNPTLSAAQALERKSAGLRYQVGRYPNPILGYFGQQMADRNTDQHGVFVEQELVRGNKLELNREVLGHTQRAQAAEIEAQQYRILTDVRVRFFEAIAAQQRLDAIRDFAAVAAKGVQVAQKRQEAEEGTLVETLQAQTLQSEIMLAKEQASVAFDGAWRDLAAIAGLNPELPARLDADLNVPAIDTDWAIAYAEIVAMSPELAAARALVCEKSALYRRQQAQPIPNVTAQLGAGYDDGTEHGMINAQLSAPIPVWNKNRGNIQAAYADYVQATREVQRIEQSIRSRLARVAADFESSLRAVRKYEDEIIPQTTRSLELSEEAYRAGELDFLQVLIVRRSSFESILRLIDAKGKLAQAASKVDGLLLTGGLDAPADYTDGDGIRGATFSGQ